MKKLNLIGVIALGMLFLNSCSTDKCECTVNGQTQTITEDDLNNGSTLNEACDDADEINRAQGAGSCEMI